MSSPSDQKNVKGCYVGAPAIFALELACQHVNAALRTDEGLGCCYLVGSSRERPDWRDVDVRYIMPDAEFAVLFPNVDLTVESALWEFDSRWLLFNTAIAQWMKVVTGLPVDFQIQPQTLANKWHSKPRSALGLKVAKQKGPTNESV